MIVLTGASGFIGSCMLSKLNGEGIDDIVIVDDFSREDRKNNWINKKFALKKDREDFIDWFKDNASQITGVFHLGLTLH